MTHDLSPKVMLELSYAWECPGCRVSFLTRKNNLYFHTYTCIECQMTMTLVEPAEEDLAVDQDPTKLH